MAGVSRAGSDASSAGWRGPDPETMSASQARGRNVRKTRNLNHVKGSKMAFKDVRQRKARRKAASLGEGSTGSSGPAVSTDPVIELSATERPCG